MVDVARCDLGWDVEHYLQFILYRRLFAIYVQPLNDMGLDLLHDKSLSLVGLLLKPHLHLVIRVKSAGTRPPNRKDHVSALLHSPCSV